MKKRFDKLPVWGKTIVVCSGLQLLAFVLLWYWLVNPLSLGLFGQLLKAGVLQIADPSHMMSFPYLGVRHIITPGAFLASEYPAVALNSIWGSLKFPAQMSFSAWLLFGKFVYSHLGKRANLTTLQPYNT